MALSGPVALAMEEQWRLAFAIFAATAFFIAIAAALNVPNGAKTATNNSTGLPALNSALTRLIIAFFPNGRI